MCSNYYMRNLAEVDIYFEKFLKHVTYSMRQSGVTDIDKRHFGTIKNRSRSMLHAAGYDPKGPMWEMAWRTTSTIFNYLDNKTTLHRSPHTRSFLESSRPRCWADCICLGVKPPSRYPAEPPKGT